MTRWCRAHTSKREGAARGSNLTSSWLTSAPLEMTAVVMAVVTTVTGKAFVALFDSVFTEIAFTYAPRTKIKQIRKCLQYSQRPSGRAMRPTLSSHNSVSLRLCKDIRTISCISSYWFRARSHFAWPEFRPDFHIFLSYGCSLYRTLIFIWNDIWNDLNN